LRPRRLTEIIGQKQTVERLRIAINACRKLKEPLGHMLFDGPPGLARRPLPPLPNELDTTIQIPLALPHSACDLLPYLTNARKFHRLHR